MIRVNQHSTNNRQVWKKENLYAWAADDDELPVSYVALFNAPAAPPRGRSTPEPEASTAAATGVSFNLGELPKHGANATNTIRDLWSHKEIKSDDKGVIAVELSPHQSALFKIECLKPK